MLRYVALVTVETEAYLRWFSGHSLGVQSGDNGTRENLPNSLGSSAKRGEMGEQHGNNH